MPYVPRACARCAHGAMAHGFGAACQDCRIELRPDPCESWVFAYDTDSGRPVSDPSETLALMAQHVHKLERLGTWGWQAFGDLRWSDSQMVVARGDGPTIGDAVRACVAKLKALDLSDRDP
jgi:hypothetical protein